MADLKARIAKRCAKEFKDGDFINLGIGLPTMVANYIAEDIMVTCHSENGVAGIDEVATAENLDVDIIKYLAEGNKIFKKEKMFCEHIFEELKKSDDGFDDFK